MDKYMELGSLLIEPSGREYSPLELLIRSKIWEVQCSERYKKKNSTIELVREAEATVYTINFATVYDNTKEFAEFDANGWLFLRDAEQLKRWNSNPFCFLTAWHPAKFNLL